MDTLRIDLFTKLPRPSYIILANVVRVFIITVIYFLNESEH